MIYDKNDNDNLPHTSLTDTSLNTLPQQIKEMIMMKISSWWWPWSWLYDHGYEIATIIPTTSPSPKSWLYQSSLTDTKTLPEQMTTMFRMIVFDIRKQKDQQSWQHYHHHQSHDYINFQFHRLELQLSENGISSRPALLTISPVRLTSCLSS